MRITVDSPFAADVLALLDEHLTEMRRVSPPESVHALDAASLVTPHIVFLTARDDGGSLLGCGAVADLGDGEAELKSMRTALTARGHGVAGSLVARLLEEARGLGATRISLETGAEPFFDPAVRLYLRAGFAPCPPFAGYTDDPNSRYLTRAL